MKKEIYNVIGLMSGTSMDGVDAALIKTNGQDYIEPISDLSIPYSSEEKDLFRKMLQVVKDSKGNLLKAEDAFSGFSEGVRLSTEYHIKAVKELHTNSVDLIGYHGQTLYHNADECITIQVGDAAYLAEQTGVSVVSDFRTNDMQNGGQGAPFAPLYHQALAKQSGYVPVVIVNCGGISNITIITDNELIAFDTGPGNALVDSYVFEKTGKDCDLDGQYGLKGIVSEKVLDLLFEKSVSINEKNFFDIAPPKSLDINDLHVIPEIYELSMEDACCTLEAFTAEAVIRSLESVTIAVPQNWIITGGGARNPVIIEQLRSRLGDKYKINKAEEVNWNNDALEAQVFAYLAVRSIKGLPLSMSGTTGVAKPVTGGVLHTV